MTLEFRLIFKFRMLILWKVELTRVTSRTALKEILKEHKGEQVTCDAKFEYDKNDISENFVRTSLPACRSKIMTRPA